MTVRLSSAARPEVELAIARACAGASSPREACTAALQEVRHALSFAFGLVYRVADESEMEIVAMSPRAIGGIDIGVGWKPLARERALITNGEPAIEGELPRDGESFTSWRLARFGLRSSVRVPLFDAGMVVGCAEIYSYEAAAFSVGDAIELESYVSALGGVLSRPGGNDLVGATVQGGRRATDVGASTPGGAHPGVRPPSPGSDATAEHLALLEQFGAAMAHELNNPLSTVLGYAQLLEDLPEAERRAAIPVIVAQAERSGAILRELLAFSRPRPIRPERLDINSVIASEAGALQRSEPGHHAVELQLAFVGDVSGDHESLPEALRRVLT